VKWTALSWNKQYWPGLYALKNATMSISDQPLDVLLETALQISDAQERQAWMQSVCRHDLEKFEELRSLVEASRKTLLIDTSLPEVQQGRRFLDSVTGLSLGPFQLLEQIGEGGMGAVYLARQKHPVQRLLAIKLIQRELESHQILERFQSEQQMLANMHHPNIAQIIDAGATDSGFLYIAMEYVKGQQLLEYCKTHQPSLSARIGLLLQCCLAIQHAHQKGTIHRDIKPSNVMVTIVDGEPIVKVIDFGIAKAFGNESLCVGSEGARPPNPSIAMGLTQVGASLGTPPYMSPEQYPNDSASVDTRSDIYSLGALMYAVLTGVPPFDPTDLHGMSLREIQHLVSNRDPQRPSLRAPTLARQLRGDLDEIVLKAMSRNVEQRYQSVGLLIEDLRSYLADAPVRANPDTLWSNARRFAKRHKIFIAASALSIAGLVVGLVAAMIQGKRATESEHQAKRQAYASDMLLSSMAIARGNYQLTKEILERNREASFDVHRGGEVRSLHRLDWRLLASQIPQEPETLAQFPTKIYFGLDLPERNELACGCKDSHLRILNRDTGSVRLDIDTQQREINGLALSPDGSTIATGGDDGTVRFYELDTGKGVGSAEVSQSSVFQIAWTADGKYFVSVGNEADARVWKLPEFEIVETLDSDGEALECLGINSQGKVAFGSETGVVRIATFSVDEPVKTQTVSASLSRIFNVNRCSAVAFSSNGSLLAVGLDNGYLVLLARAGDSYHMVERIRFPTTVTAIAFNRDQSKLALGENSGSVHLLNLPDAWPTRSRLRFTKYFYDNNSFHLPESDRQPSKLWDLVVKTEPPDVAREVPLDTDEVYLEFSAGLKDVIFADNYLREWVDESGQTRPDWNEIPASVIYRGDGIELRFGNRYSGWTDFKTLESQGRLTSWASHKKRVASIVWNPLETKVQSFSEDGSIRRFPSNSVRTRSFGGQDVNGLLLLSGDRLALITSDFQPRFIRVKAEYSEPWPVESLLEGQETAAGLVAKDDENLYFVRRDHTNPESRPRAIYQWDLETNSVGAIATLPESMVPLYLVGVGTRDRVIVLYQDLEESTSAASELFGLLCWDLKNDQLSWKQPSVEEKPRMPKLSPNGMFVAYVQELGKRCVILMDASTGMERTLDYFGDLDVLALCFSADDQFLAVALSDNRIVCFRTADGSLAWTIKVSGSPARDLAWSTDGTTIACVGLDGYLRTFDADLRLMTSEILLPLKSPVGLRLSPDEKWLYVMDRDGGLIRMPCGSDSTTR
jgi:serine/threonine protein kinase/WD40 repeat protein